MRARDLGLACGALPPGERNSIADVPEALELTDADKRLIEERLASRQMDPSAGSPWQAVYDRITSKPR